MYLVAHQDDCQMVVGAPVWGKEHHVEVVDGDVVEFTMTNGTSVRQCTCEPQLIPLRFTGGDNENPGYTIPSWFHKT